MRSVFFLISISCCCLPVFGQTIDPIEFEVKISELNDAHKYEASILRIEEVIANKQASKFDRFHAYLQKSLTYKRLYNYSQALINLDLALNEVQGSQEQYLDYETRILIERIFIYFDLQNHEQLKVLLAKVKEENLKYIKRETKAFYVSVLAALSMWDKDYVQAEKHLNEAIVILEQTNPKHLPNVYRMKVTLYGILGDHEKAIESFELGLFYAEKYKLDIYKLIMYETISTYYQNKKDYKSALEFQEKVRQEQTKYNANNRSGDLNQLENDLIRLRQDLELNHERVFRYYLISISVVLIVLLFTLWRLLLVSSKKRKMVEKENDHIRSVIEVLTLEHDGKGQARVELNASGLSERQLAIVRLVKQGKTNKEIGAELFISENTVKYHLKIIYDILGVESRAVLKVNFK